MSPFALDASEVAQVRTVGGLVDFQLGIERQQAGGDDAAGLEGLRNLRRPVRLSGAADAMTSALFSPLRPARGRRRA